MKKIFAIVLSAVLCLCMAVPAFAAGTPEAEHGTTPLGIVFWSI